MIMTNCPIKALNGTNEPDTDSEYTYSVESKSIKKAKRSQATSNTSREYDKPPKGAKKTKGSKKTSNEKVASKKNRVEFLNAFKREKSSKGRGRHKSAVGEMKPIKLSQKQNVYLKNQEEQKETDDGISIEIIDQSDLERATNNENCLVVDLRDIPSPKITHEKGMPILNISLKDYNAEEEQKGKKSSKQPQRSKSLYKSLDQSQDSKKGIFSTVSMKQPAQKSARFGKMEEEIDVSEQNTLDYGGTCLNQEKLVSKGYKPPERHENFSRFFESSGQVLIDTITDDKNKRTSELINDALNTIETVNNPGGIIDAPSIDNITPIKKKIDLDHKNDDTLDFEVNPNPILDTTPSHYPSNRPGEQMYDSPLKKAYQNMIKQNEMKNETPSPAKDPKRTSTGKKKRDTSNIRKKLTKKEDSKTSIHAKNREYSNHKHLTPQKKKASKRKSSKSPLRNSKQSKNNIVGINIELEDDLDSTVDENHKKFIQNSANKLRSKMQSQAMLKTQTKSIEVNFSSKETEKDKNTQKISQTTENAPNNEGKDLTIGRNEASKLTVSDKKTISNIEMISFSPSGGKQLKINQLEEKLTQSERIILELQNRLELNENVYKEKYEKTKKEIQELERDNISLHQMVKSKINETSELKNKNTELQHKISSNNMLSQKMSMTEEELRMKINDLMNKNTELNFLLRQKDEEVQGEKNKLKNIQIDLSNAQNVETGLNKEITQLKKDRESISAELRDLKDEKCSIQVELREQKGIIDNLQRENKEFKSRFEVVNANSDKMEKEIASLNTKLSAQQHIDDKVHMYEQEREIIKQELLRISKCQMENEVYKSPSLSTDYKLSRPIDITGDTVNGILSKMATTDSKCGISSYNPSLNYQAHTPMEYKTYANFGEDENLLSNLGSKTHEFKFSKKDYATFGDHFEKFQSHPTSHHYSHEELSSIDVKNQHMMDMGERPAGIKSRTAKKELNLFKG
ncbi:unnamed protein product [Moneuplotes crassus]|uniref:Uncharacterized protein n=1 Tax=Euplotes crassus TaxID=5936 RepID=A0AAD1XKP7_EUPCR|nr:unnamed protein product [Moneuplotes crassus]